MQDGFAIPAVERSFAGGPYAAVEGCQDHILTTGEALLSFWHMAVDGADNLQFFSDIPESCQGAKLKDPGLQRLYRLLAQAVQQPFCGSQVYEDDRPRLTIYSSRFDDLPVGVTAGDFLLDGGHDISVYISVTICQEKSFRRLCVTAEMEKGRTA